MIRTNEVLLRVLGASVVQSSLRSHDFFVRFFIHERNSPPRHFGKVRSFSHARSAGTGRSFVGRKLINFPPASAALHAAGCDARTDHAPIGGVPAEARGACSRFPFSRSRS